jgi:beta-glucosidase
MRTGRRNALKGMAGLSALGALAPLGTLKAADAPPAYKDASLPVEARVKDLLSRMTLEEKVAQMIALWATKADILADGSSDFSAAKAAKAYPNGFGQITRASDRKGAPDIPGTRWRTSEDTVRLVNEIQRWAVERTRLGIPVLFHEECLHGFMGPDATMFPMAIGLAGSFDPGLVREVNSVIARESRAHGAHLVLSPVVDIARDPRWGRIEETFGEDSYVCSEMGVAAVLGLQGEGRTLREGQVFATLKHMTGHGQPQAGRNVAPAFVGERELYESFFPPFREVVARTGIQSVMPSYNEIDGIPSHANRWLIDHVLRGEWKFDGVIVSDYFAVEQLASLHHVAADNDDAAACALATGVDSELPDGKAYRNLPALVRADKVPEWAIDTACARILALKFRAGLFESPYADAEAARTLTGNDEARALALRAARRSICLLSNDGTLPLTAGAQKRIAVIGPNAAIARLGGYSSKPKQTVSLLEGVKKRVGDKAEVVFAQGMHITQSEEREADDVRLGDPAKNRALIAEAAALARSSDVVLLAIGDTEQTSREAYSTNHLGDRSSLDLVGDQNALLDALHETGKPIVVLAINGRPPSYPNVVAKARAILEFWYPGQEGGTAMAEAIFGDWNPGAKLPVTVARDVSQVPIYNSERATPRLGEGDRTPLFPFGFGLSYTRFELAAPNLSVKKIRAGESVVVEVPVRNSGTREGDEVVQVYVHPQRPSHAQPVKRLAGFTRVTLKPGESRTVRITLEAKAFRIRDALMKETIEPGLFDILAGPNSRDLQATVLEIAAAT